MIDIVERLNKVVWGIPLLLLIVFVGLHLSVQTGFVQLRWFPKAVRVFFSKFRQRGNADGTSSYRALCTALAATVGTGNIAGVAGAISIGGPGAIFWMWVCALLGMVTKFAEATLAVHFREKNQNGEYVGGPMYMIKNAMPAKFHFLAYVYCFFGIVASFGVGNGTQINAVIGGVHSIVDWFGEEWSIRMDFFLGVILATVILMMMLGGARRIGSIAEMLVPYAAVGYMLLCAIVLVLCRRQIPYVLETILNGAFAPDAVTGGAVGSLFMTLRIGASRGIFTNEAGMGTASIAHAASDVKDPTEQGLMGVMEVFIDTIVICTMTALVILCSGVSIPYGDDIGVTLTTNAFSAVLGQWVCIPITIALCCFALATVLGWGLYGIRCAQFLFGDSVWKRFVWLQGITAVISALLGTGTVWLLAETVNGLMAIPNLIVLAFLAPQLHKLAMKRKTKKNFRIRFTNTPNILTKYMKKW